MSTVPGSVVRFGVFEVDLRGGDLRKKGLKIRLQDQPFQVLLALLESNGEVVTREELYRRLWAENTFVDFDHSLNTAIRRLRAGKPQEALRLGEVHHGEPAARGGWAPSTGLPPIRAGTPSRGRKARRRRKAPRVKSSAGQIGSQGVRKSRLASRNAAHSA